MTPHTDKETSSLFARFGNFFNIEAPLLIGFVVHICWFLFAFSELISRGNSDEALYSLPDIIFAVLFIVVFFVTCLVVGFLRQRITMRLRYKRIHFAIAFCNVVGSLLFFSLLATPFPPLFAVISALLCGASYATMTILWGEAARRRLFARLSIMTCIALIIATLIVSFASLVLQSDIARIIICLAPLMSVIGMYKAQHDNESYLKPQEFVTLPDGSRRAKEGALWKETYHDLKISKRRFALKLGQSAFFFGLPFSFLAFESYSFFEDKTVSLDFYFPLFFTLSSILVFFILNALMNPTESANFSKRLFLFFIVFIIFTLGGTARITGVASGAETLALLVLFATTLWLYPSELSHRYRISPLLTFGFFVGFFSLGLSVYTILHMVINPSGIPGYVTAIINIACSLIGFFLLVNDKQMRDISLIDGVDSGGQATQASSRAGIFTMRCKKTADIFLLSQREYEILILLAKGRNASHIQKELFIAEGTVKTHMRNIYRKMSVHNQQELMDFVEKLSLD